ncbi:NucA/NucB deoxyribonuclease domain-containing protein [Corynebacterium glutamicum]|uniref:NucA/NucB deoxyribonuclease domain-containing protein n=1 Tax=Corynebacterium glutamicum TaxID=1718 RepID=UPI00155E6459
MPFASSEEGGSSIRGQWVPRVENNSQGGSLSSFYKYNQVTSGDKFRVGLNS